jgi:hypothetical protein
MPRAATSSPDASLADTASEPSFDKTEGNVQFLKVMKA